MGPGHQSISPRSNCSFKSQGLNQDSVERRNDNSYRESMQKVDLER